MAPVCVLLALQCPLCGSPVVWVKEAGQQDRLICPVCWAAGERREGGIEMQRGQAIPPMLKYLVDKARFPRLPPASADSPSQEVAPDEGGHAKRDSGKA